MAEATHFLTPHWWPLHIAGTPTVLCFVGWLFITLSKPRLVLSLITPILLVIIIYVNRFEHLWTSLSDHLAMRYSPYCGWKMLIGAMELITIRMWGQIEPTSAKDLFTVSARIIERSQEDKSTVKYRTFVLLRVPIRSGVGKFNYRTGRRTKVRHFTVLLSSWLRSIISGTDMIFTAYLYIYNL